jgi:hypothetical protein
MRECRVDCYGTSYVGDVRVAMDGIDILFAYTEAARSSPAFSLGLFVDDTTVSRAPYRYPRGRRVALLLESPLKPFYAHGEQLARVFSTVYTFSEPLLARGSPFQLFPYGMSWIPQAAAGRLPGKTRLVSFVGSIEHPDNGGYALRKEVVRRLAARGSVDLFGKGIREIASKLVGLQPYGFSIAMENARHNYYFTEKLIDCFLTGTVPIYWGCPDIGRFFDPRGVLSFETPAELDTIVDALSWERYEAMRPYLESNRDTVLSAGWHTYEGLYTRLGRLLLERYRPVEPLSPGRTSKVAAGIRWLVEGLSHP